MRLASLSPLAGLSSGVMIERWQNSPHLSVSLAYLEMCLLSHRENVRMYRMSASLAPYATHRILLRSDQVSECRDELRVRSNCRRIGSDSTHAVVHRGANAPTSDLGSGFALRLQADILDGMQLGTEAVVVTHVGGVFGDACAARERFAENILTLPLSVRRRLVLENDDARFSVSDIVWVHDRTGMRLVFDYLHHRINNPEALSVRTALDLCLASWPTEQIPKVHFSSPRTEWLVESESPSGTPRLRRTRWSRHSDYINPFEFIDFMAIAEGLRPFDVMLEARARDLAVVRLREDLVNARRHWPSHSPARTVTLEDLQHAPSARN
jgi:UV DNA damage endonuclease